ncbi:MAG TPA: hypothetical protein VIL68_05915 [Propionibacteriaceae bacterium]
MTAGLGLAICVGVFFATMAAMVVVDVVLHWWRQGGHTVDAAQDAAADAELREMIEGPR